MKKYTFHYTMVDGGDGSASVHFYADAASAKLAGEIEDENQPFGDNVKSETLYFDDNGVLLNPAATKKQLERKLADLRGEEEMDDTAQEEMDDYQGKKTEQLKKAFNSEAAPQTKTDMDRIELFYSICNLGSGEASVDFYVDKESAALAGEIEDEKGEAFGDNVSNEVLYFDGSGELLNPEARGYHLNRWLAEKRGEELTEGVEDSFEVWQQKTNLEKDLEKKFKEQQSGSSSSGKNQPPKNRNPKP